MKKIHNRFFYLFIFRIVLGIGYWGLWWFLSLHIIEQDMWPYTIAYTSFTWKLINAHEALAMVRKTLSGENIHRFWVAAIFGYEYVKGKSKCTTMNAWYVIDPQDIKRLNKKSHLYMIKHIESAKKMIIVFPYKSSLWNVIGHIRNVWKMNVYLQSKNYTKSTIVEIFDKDKATISYIAEAVQ